MREPTELHLSLKENEIKETTTLEDNNCSLNQFLHQPTPNTKTQTRYYKWFLVSLYSVFIIAGQASATLLGRLYYEKSGQSKWMGTLVQVIGFPILIPYFFFSKNPKTDNSTSHNSETPSSSSPSTSMLVFVYVSLGLFDALACYLDSIGLAYLPVSTFSLITSSRLAFNAFFSFFINSMKFTPYIVNSLVLLTITPVLLVFDPDDSNNNSRSTGDITNSSNYVIGFIASLAGSVSSGLLFSLTQLCFEKVMKRNNTKVIIEMIVYESFVATCVTLVGLFASGDWNELKEEMEEYETGKVSYLLNLTFTAINWQIYTIGSVGLVSEVSSLFSNAIMVLDVPIVPILAVFIFNDKMGGIKVICLVLAVWGFVSYVYQHYLDDKDSNAENRIEISVEV